MAVTGQVDTIWQGNRRILRFTITDEDTPGSPLKDLTGMDIKFALARFDTNGNPIKLSPPVDLSLLGTPSQVVCSAPTTGVVDVILLSANTVNLNPGDYYFELELFSGPSSVVVATGTLTINVNVANA